MIINEPKPFIALPSECEEFEGSLLLPVGHPLNIDGGQTDVWTRPENIQDYLDLSLFDCNEVVAFTRTYDGWVYIGEPCRVIEIDVADPADFDMAVQEARLLINR